MITIHFIKNEWTDTKGELVETGNILRGAFFKELYPKYQKCLFYIVKSFGTNFYVLDKFYTRENCKPVKLIKHKDGGLTIECNKIINSVGCIFCI
jgi:hypothetical protein